MRSSMVAISKWPLHIRSPPSPSWYIANKCNRKIKIEALHTGLYCLTDANKESILSEIEKTISTDPSQASITKLRRTASTNVAKAHPEFFHHFPDRYWLLNALVVLSRRHRQDSRKQERRIRDEKIKITSMISLVPQDLRVKWRVNLSDELMASLKSLQEARSDANLLRMWGGQLPQVEKLDVDDSETLIKKMTPTIFKNIKNTDMGADGQAIEKVDKKLECAAFALYQMNQKILDPGLPIHVVRNVTVPDAAGMHVKDSWLEKHFTVARVPATGGEGNITPRGHLTDIHNGTYP